MANVKDVVSTNADLLVNKFHALSYDDKICICEEIASSTIHNP
jgi:hypothetical protein